jgi:hypothetical protein
LNTEKSTLKDVIEVLIQDIDTQFDNRFDVLKEETEQNSNNYIN